MEKRYNITELNDYLDSLRDKSIHTIRMYRTAIDKFVIGTNIKTFDDIKNITVRDADKYQRFLQETLSASSVNSNIRPVNAMYNWLIAREYLDRNPFSRIKSIKENEKVQAFLSNQEMISMVSHAQDTEEKLMLLMLLQLGLRRSELTGISVDDVATRTHIVINGKGGKQRLLALHSDIVGVLNRWIAIRNQRFPATNLKWLFISRVGGRYSGDTIRRRIKAIMTRAGFSETRINEIHTHSLRHTFTANLFEGGADIYVAQQLLGHSDINTTRRYAHLRDNVRDNAVLQQKSILGK
jgi:site-specific recombinase XerD